MGNMPTHHSLLGVKISAFDERVSYNPTRVAEDNYPIQKFLR